jgi:hypothetical protein
MRVVGIELLLAFFYIPCTHWGLRAREISAFLKVFYRSLPHQSGLGWFRDELTGK